MAMNRWDLATKWEPKHHDVLCSKHLKKKKKKKLHRSHPAEHSVWAQIHVHRVTDLERFPVRISKDEAPTPLPVVGPLFISPLSFHLSRALLGAWRFGLFRCVYSSFHNRLNLIREPHQGACLLSFGCLVSVCCPAVLLSLLSGLYRVHGLRVSSLCHVARWHFLPPFFFSESVCLLLSFCFPSLLFHRTSFVFISGLLAIS